MKSNYPCGLVLLAALSIDASAQTLLRSVNGPAAAAQFGKPCITVPDQNGDGFKDLLIGAPGFNSGRGAIYCLSGAYLSTGTGTQTLWSLAPAVNPGDKFGYALIDLGDVTLDNEHDFLVGQPGYDFAGSSDVGAVRLLDGSSRSLVSLVRGAASAASPGAGALFGSAIAACGDVDGDGMIEVVIGAPGSMSSYLRVVNGWTLFANGSSLLGSMTTSFGASGNSGLGSAIVSGFDLDGDGFQEYAYSSPGFDGPAGVDTGVVEIREASPGFPPVGFYLSTIPSERFGQAIDAAHDYDGDGVTDIVVGAPNSPSGTAFEVGRAVVLSGARVASQTPPYEIYTFGFGSPAPPVNHADPEPDFHFGAAVRACADLTGDGVGEIMVGAPDYFTQTFSGSWIFRGFVQVFSGATGTQISGIAGASTDRLGDGLNGAIGDLDGDGFDEFALAGSLSDAGGADSGVVKCYRLFPVAPSIYCTGKINSLGCVPYVISSGSPDANSPAPFTLSCNNVLNQVSGLYFYSHAPKSSPFQGGTLCVESPTRRTAVLNSGGSAIGTDCTGVFSYDFNARIQSGVDATLVAGAEAFVQCWSRDPASASTTSLSNAIRFVINP